jgi:RNA polymerase subunit RPABC4/transcription elongation factor Spt4
MSHSGSVLGTCNIHYIQLMKKKECPSCAMDIDENSRQCPICGYEFVQTNSGWIKWVALVLLLIILFMWIF